MSAYEDVARRVRAKLEAEHAADEADRGADEADRAELARLRTFRAEIEGVLSHSANQGWIALGPVRDALNRARS